MRQTSKIWPALFWFTATLGPTASGQHPRELAALRGHESPVTTLSFSPDGRMLASGGRDRTIKIWELATLKERHTLQAPEESAPVRLLDGGTLITGTGTVAVTQLYGGAEPRLQRCPEPAFPAGALSHDGLLVVAVRKRDFAIFIWNRAKNAVERSFGARTGLPSDVFALSTQTGVLAVAGGKERDHVVLWNSALGKKLAELPDHPSQVPQLLFSPDGRTLATGCWDGVVRLWDAASGQRLRAFRVAMDESILSLGYSPDGNMLVAGCSDHAIWLWDLASGGNIAKLAHVDSVVSLAFSLDGKLLAAGSGNLFGKGRNEIKLWDVSRLRRP